MKLISIEDNLMVNADLIEAAEIKTEGDIQLLSITIGGRDIIVRREPLVLLQKLIEMSMDKPKQQYTAV